MKKTSKNGINMTELLSAIEELEKTENISAEFLLESLVIALEAAYKENYETEEEVVVEIDEENKELQLKVVKEVVDEIDEENSEKQILLEDAKKIEKSAKVGDTIKIVINPKDFGRIAAQKGKQIIIQKLREKEKELKFDEYTTKTGEIITGLVQKAEGGTVVLDLGNIEGIMPLREQVQSESYFVNQRLRVYVNEVRHGHKGDVQVVVSRSTPDMVKRLFEYEIPEIDEGLIEIKSVSREAGNRSKVAVYSSNENIDPVGSCVGPKGIRIQNIVDELNGEKIDVVEWNETPSTFIASALLPAEILAIDIDEENRFAQVIVPDDQLSLAIGKSGLNVRLSVSLTKYKIDIKSESQFREIIEKMSKEETKNLEIDVLENDEDIDKLEEELEVNEKTEIDEDKTVKEQLVDELQKQNLISQEEVEETEEPKTEKTEEIEIEQVEE